MSKLLFYSQLIGLLWYNQKWPHEPENWQISALLSTPKPPKMSDHSCYTSFPLYVKSLNKCKYSGTYIVSRAIFLAGDRLTLLFLQERVTTIPFKLFHVVEWRCRIQLDKDPVAVGQCTTIHFPGNGLPNTSDTQPMWRRIYWHLFICLRYFITHYDRNLTINNWNKETKNRDRGS